MPDIKETSIVLARKDKQEVVKLLELLNSFSKEELTALLMFVQGAKFSRQLRMQSDDNTS